MQIARKLALLALAALTAALANPQAAHAGTPGFDHVFVIVMENKGYSEIMGSSQAPYINSLASRYGLATNYHAVTHPSLPNYLSLTGGDTFGITTDCTSCWVNAANITDRVEAAGRSWKAYEESIPGPCFVGDSYPYAQKHDPFIYFNDIRTNSARCNRVVPYTQLAADLGSVASTPSYGFITPNMCDDTHYCSIAAGDQWLSANVPSILNSPAFTTRRSVLFITWDEDDTPSVTPRSQGQAPVAIAGQPARVGGPQGQMTGRPPAQQAPGATPTPRGVNPASTNRVATIVAGPVVKSGYISMLQYDHYSLMRTIELAWGLAPLTANDAGAPAMLDFFAA